MAVFVTGGVTEDVASMPGVKRYSLDDLVPVVKHAQALGIPAIALFPNTDEALKTPQGEKSFNPDNLILRR